MNEVFERKGIWWIPSKPDNRVHGTLKYDPLHGPSVDLFGNLLSIDFSEESESCEIVLGSGANGEPMTLLYCYESNSHYSSHALYSGNFTVTTVSASVLITGQHFDRIEDVQFDKLTFQFARARDWADVMQVKPAKDEQKVSLTYIKPDTHDISLPDGLVLSLDYGVSVQNTFSGASLQKFVSWIVEANSDRNFEEWWKIQFRLQSFLNLATRHAVHPLQARRVTEVTVELPNGTEGKTYHETQLFWDIVEATDEEETSGGRNMLFRLIDLGTGEVQRANLEKCLNAWFAKAERLETICELYNGTLYRKRTYPIHRFSNLIQALESYHRGATNQEMTLRTRMEQLVTTYEQVLARPFDRKTEFLQKVLDTRNYLTHYDPRKKERAASGRELHGLSQSLQRLLEMCLMQELEIEEFRIRHILSRAKNQWGWLEKPTSN